MEEWAYGNLGPQPSGLAKPKFALGHGPSYPIVSCERTRGEDLFKERRQKTDHEQTLMDDHLGVYSPLSDLSYGFVEVKGGVGGLQRARKFNISRGILMAAATWQQANSAKTSKRVQTMDENKRNR